MTAATWITMIVICGFVWGGFVIVLSKAIKGEAGRTEHTP